MKILRANDFISERIKLQPITNAELDRAKKEINAFRIIDNPKFDDIKPGMAALCEIVIPSHSFTTTYIVFDSTQLPPFLMEVVNKKYQYDGNLLLIKYDTLGLTFAVAYLSLDDFRKNFPYNSRKIQILNVYDAKINTLAIEDVEDLKKELVKLNKNILNLNFKQ